MVSLRFEVMKFPMLASPPSMTPEVISRILTDVHFHTQVWRACKTKITCLFLGRTRTRSNGWAFHARTFWPKQAIYLKPSANIGAIACFLGKCMRFDLFVLVTFIYYSQNFRGFKYIRECLAKHASDLAAKDLDLSQDAEARALWNVVKLHDEIKVVKRPTTRGATNGASSKKSRKKCSEPAESVLMRTGLLTFARLVKAARYWCCTGLLGILCSGNVPGIAKVPLDFRIALFHRVDDELVVSFMRHGTDAAGPTYVEHNLADDDTDRRGVHALVYRELVGGNHFDRLVGTGSKGSDPLLLDLTKGAELELAKACAERLISG